MKHKYEVYEPSSTKILSVLGMSVIFDEVILWVILSFKRYNTNS